MDKIEDKIREEYRRVCPSWKNVSVDKIYPQTPHGRFATVWAKEGGDEVDDLCYIDREGNVHAYASWEGLAERLTKELDYKRYLATPEAVSAIAFLITLLSVIGLTIAGAKSEDGFKALIGILGLAAGFFFANQGKRA